MKIKKTAAVLCTLTAVLLCGCGPDAAGPASDLPDISGDSGTFSKAQKITIVPADAEKTGRNITANREIDAFITEMEPENWKIESIPESAEETGTFQFSQEETIKLGQTENNGRMQTLCEITAYDSPYIKLQLSGFYHPSFSFKISPEAADYLNGYLYTHSASMQERSHFLYADAAVFLCYNFPVHVKLNCKKLFRRSDYGYKNNESNRDVAAGRSLLCPYSGNGKTIRHHTP